MNPSLEHCSESRIEEERRSHRVIIQIVEHDVRHLFQIVPVNGTLILLTEHLADANLAYILDGEVPELINCLPPLMP